MRGGGQPARFKRCGWSRLHGQNVVHAARNARLKSSLVDGVGRLKLKTQPRVSIVICCGVVEREWQNVRRLVAVFDPERDCKNKWDAGAQHRRQMGKA